MTIKKRNCCLLPSIGLSAMVVAALCGTRAVAAASDASPPPAASGMPQSSSALHLYLDVTVNGVRLRRLMPFVLRGRALYASAGTLHAMGLKPPGAGVGDALVGLDTLSGLQ